MPNSDTHAANQSEGRFKPSIILTTPEAARFLGLATSTLNKWRVFGEGPVFIKLGRAVRYRKNDLDVFLAERARHSTSEA